MKVNDRVSVLLIMSLMMGFSSIEARKKAQLFPAAFVFGDSLIDPGNNIPFTDSLAKANFPPYGVDSNTGPTGRFSNGKTFLDFLGELLGLPPLPSYVDTVVKGANILSGVNYASAGAGILRDTGYVFGHVIPLREQIDNFRNTLKQLGQQMQEEEMNNYLANALVIIQMGANDYIDNYVLPPYRTINPQHFAHLLIELYTQYILEIKNLRLRKFLIIEVAPVGCMPLVVNRGLAPQGECVSSINNLVQMFNSRLKSLVYTLNSDYPHETLFTLAAAFQPFMDLRDNSHVYGLKVKDKACCVGIASNSTMMYPKVCFRNSVPCSNRDEYVFWDYAHPTQAVNRILVNQTFNNTSYYYPYTLHQIAQI